MKTEVRQSLAEYLRFARELGLETTSLNPRRFASAQPAGKAGAKSAPAAARAAAVTASPSPAARPAAPPPAPGPASRRVAPASAGSAAADAFSFSIPAMPQANEKAQRPAFPASESLSVIRADLGECTRCKLHSLGRHSIVFGDGSARARLVFVGEGPGADEDEQGLPFVGRAGQLLTDMIEKGMGLARSEVYICNVVKCRPPGNRTPEADEISSCLPFLHRQLRALAPELIIALGATAAHALLGTQPGRGPLNALRGRLHRMEIAGWPARVLVTYHPAYLLRDPRQKKEAWKDLQIAMHDLKLEVKPTSL